VRALRAALRLAAIWAVFSGYAAADDSGESTAPDEEAVERPRNRVEITESSAVVYVLVCPKGAEPVWQSLRIYPKVSVAGFQWVFGDHATVCGVEVGGTEDELILACQRPDGTHHGSMASWHADGHKRSEGTCREDRAHGEWRRYYRNGQLKVEGRYKRGRKIGRWSLWSPKGKKRTTSARHLTNTDPLF